MRSDGKGNGSGRDFGLVRYSDVPDREIDPYWETGDGIYLAKGFVTILAGLRGRGKSGFAAWLAAMATIGFDELRPPEPHNVVIVSIEDPIDAVVKPRVLAAGGDVLRVFGRDRLFLPSEKEKLIEQLVTERPSCSSRIPSTSAWISVFVAATTTVSCRFCARSMK
jgi:hypothetical protein